MVKTKKIWYAGKTLTGLDFSNKIEFPSRASATKYVRGKKRGYDERIWIVRGY